MYIFIDESGVHKQLDHTVYALAYVAVSAYSDLEQKIVSIERELGIESFHWAKTVWKVKERFMDSVLRLDFTAKLAILKNPVSPERELERILEHMLVERGIRSIFIDGKKPSWYERKIKHTLRRKGISVRKLRTVSDTQYAGIRLADMIAGLARSCYDKKNIERLLPYFRRLQKKITVTVT